MTARNDEFQNFEVHLSRLKTIQNWFRLRLYVNFIHRNDVCKFQVI